MASSPRLIVLLRCSHCVLPRFYGVLAGDSKRLKFSLCLRGAFGVYIAFPRRSHRALRRSGTALTVVGKLETKSVICTFSFQAYPGICENDHTENF